MNRRQWLNGIGAAGILTALGPTGRLSAAPRHWMQDAIVFDGLAGLFDSSDGDYWSRLSDAYWEKVQTTGVTVVRTTVTPVGNHVDGWERFRSTLADHQRLVAENPDRLILVRKAADIRVAKASGKIGFVLGTQDTSFVGPELDRLAEIKQGGISVVQLTYNNRNLSGDGAIEPDNAGLSKLGRATIERIEAEQLLLDLSHGGAKTMAQAADMARRPLVISHTGARAVYDHPRNTSDETIRAVADKGGAVGLYFMPFLGRPTTGELLLRHADHLLNVAGEDHVAIGSDNGPMPVRMDAEAKAKIDADQRRRVAAGIAAPGEEHGFYPYVEDYNSTDRLFRFADDLAKRGWTRRQLEKLMGTNLLRVCEEAWDG